MSCVAFETGSIGSKFVEWHYSLFDLEPFQKGAVGYNISGLAVQIAVLCGLGIVYIYLRLFRSIRDDHFTLYLGFSLFSAFALFCAAIQRMLPFAPVTEAARNYHIGLEVFLGAVISMQWLVQTGALFFLVIRNPGDRKSILWVVIGSFFAAFCLLVPWTVSIAIGKAYIGEVMDESLLILLFGLALLSTSRECSQCLPERMKNARPMLRVWAGFMFVAHASFLVMYSVRASLPGNRFKKSLFMK